MILMVMAGHSVVPHYIATLGTFFEFEILAFLQVYHQCLGCIEREFTVVFCAFATGTCVNNLIGL